MPHMLAYHLDMTYILLSVVVLAKLKHMFLSYSDIFLYVRYALMMKAVYTSQMSVYCYEALWYNVPEDCHLHIFIPIRHI
jgi:hypothetical protein